jgi:trigger factor
MKVTVNKEPNCRRLLEIEIPQEEVAARFNGLVAEYRAEASIPGFRKGKAPSDLVKKRYYESIKKDLTEKLMTDYFVRALKQEKMDKPYDAYIHEGDEVDETKPYKFKVMVETFPEFEPDGYKGLKTTKKVREVTDTDIDETLQYIQRSNAEYHPVERACHDQDLVVVDLIKKYDKMNRLDDKKLENVEVDLGGDGVLKEFKDGLKGMKIGEMKDIEVKYPDDYSDKLLAGNEVTYTAVVKEVKEIKLLELNDDFAKDYGQADSLDQLKKDIKQNLDEQASREANNDVKSDLIKQIVDKNKFEIPESMIENYLKSVTEDFKKRYKDVDELKLRQNYRQVGEDTIRWQFLFRKIAGKENLQVSEQDRAEWVKQFAAQYNMTEQTARESLGRAGKFEDIDDNLLERKVLDLIMENATISS